MVRAHHLHQYWIIIFSIYKDWTSPDFPSFQKSRYHYKMGDYLAFNFGFFSVELKPLQILCISYLKFILSANLTCFHTGEEHRYSLKVSNMSQCLQIFIRPPKQMQHWGSPYLYLYLCLRYTHSFSISCLFDQSGKHIAFYLSWSLK